MSANWITTKKASEISGYHAESIRELLREGKVEGRKFGTIWQVDQTSLLAYVQRMEDQGDRRGPKPRNN